jgi:hypothetical protein
MRPHRASKRDNTSFGETPQALAILEKFARVIAENRISPPMPIAISLDSSG